MKNKKENEGITPAEAVKRAEQILNYPPPIKTRGFEEVKEKYKEHDCETIIPTRGSKNSAGYDLYSKEDINIDPGKKYLFWTDIKTYMMPNEVCQIYVRSSIGVKKGLVLCNQVGIIDSDYFENPENDGNIGVCLKNETNVTQTIKKGERIAQAIFMKYQIADNIISEDMRTGGIGSTDNLNISSENKSWLNEYTNNQIQNSGNTLQNSGNTFQPLLPIAMKIAAKTIASGGWNEESDERIKRRKRIVKLKRILDKKSFRKIVSKKEENEIMKVKREWEDGLVSVKPLSGPTNNLIYFDYKYESDSEKKRKKREKKLKRILKRH